MSLLQSPHPSISPLTLGYQDIHPLLYRQIPTLKEYYMFTFFLRSISHWNTLPAHIPVFPTLAQISSAVCQVIHVSP